MRFTANVWVYRDVLYRPGTPFEAPSKLSEAWTEVAPLDQNNVPTTVQDSDTQQDEPARSIYEKPRRGRPPKDK
jgi:hypothetical protein